MDCNFGDQRRCPLRITGSKGASAMGLRESCGAEHSRQPTELSKLRRICEANEALTRCSLRKSTFQAVTPETRIGTQAIVAYVLKREAKDDRFVDPEPT